MIENRITHKYDDIIEMEHHTSKTRPRMSAYDRAAQFSPFAALTGHEAAIKETARLTECEKELDEGEKARLNEKLQMIKDNLESEIEVTITYFQPDERKSGGAYLRINGYVKRIDTYAHRIIMKDKTVIPIDEISEIESQLFKRFE